MKVITSHSVTQSVNIQTPNISLYFIEGRDNCVKMVKINTVEFRKQLKSRQTKTSVFIKFLIKICFLPITSDDGVLRFRFLSKKTLAHVVIYWGLFLLLLSVYSSFIMDHTVLSKILEQNSLEIFSIMSGFVCNISILFPLLLSRGLNNMDIGMVWNDRMPFPKHGVSAIVTQFVVVAGFFGAFWGYISPLDIPADTQDKISSVSLFGNICF